MNQKSDPQMGFPVLSHHKRFVFSCKAFVRISVAFAAAVLSFCCPFSAEGQEVLLQKLGYGSLGKTVWSPDHRYIASSGGGGAFLWDVETQTMIRSFQGHSGSVVGVAFSPDSRYLLTGSLDGTAKLWDISSGRTVYSIHSGEPSVYSIAFSPNGELIATGAVAIKLWNASDGSHIRTISGTNGWSINSMAFSPNGSSLLCGGSPPTGVLNLIDVASGALIRSYTGHTMLPNNVCFSPDGGQIASASWQSARVWNTATGSLIHTFTASNIIWSAEFMPNGAGIVGAIANTGVQFWDAASGNETDLLPVTHPNSARPADDGMRLLTTDYEQFIRIWDVGSGEQLSVFSGHTSGNSPKARFSSDGSMVVSRADDNAFRIWNTNSGILSKLVSNPAVEVSFSNDNQFVGIASAGFFPRASIWRVDNGQFVRAFNHPALTSDAEFSPDGNYFLTCGHDKLLKLWDISTGNLLRNYAAHSTVIRCAAFSPDSGRIVSGDGSGNGTPATALVWNTSTGDVITTLSGHTDAIQDVRFSPDGSVIATGSSDGTARIWNSFTGSLLITLSGFGPVHSVAFSPDNKVLATGHFSTLSGGTRLWDVQTGALLKTFLENGGQTVVTSAMFSPDGTRLLTADGLGNIKIRELNPPVAIIIAGGGPFPGNGIAEQTDYLADYTFRTLKGRIYDGSDIKYLSAFQNHDADGDGLDDVDAAATLDSFHNTLTSDFATSAGRLLILMLDHGYKTDNFMAFRMNETQTLPSTTLNQWLNDLQSSYPVDVTLVVDSCYSGKIVDDCSTPPAGRLRTVISSTTRDAEAVFVPSPDLSSFMYTFLGSAYMGNSIGEAWRAGQRFFEAFPVANQVPQISDGSTTTTNADREFFGKSWAYGVQSTIDINQFFPAFEDWSSTQTVAPSSPVYVYAGMLPGQDPTSVTCVVRTPAPSVLSGDPITTLPRLALTRRSDNSSSPDYRIWETTSTTELFSATGAYTLSFSAQFSFERVSNPVFTNITVSSGTDPDQTPIRSILAVGNSENTAISTSLQNIGPFAYSTFLRRFADNGGVSHPEWIDYYSAFTDPNRDATAGSSNILNSIDALPLDVGRLYIHLIGDSYGPGSVRMGAGDKLTATALDSSLDALQSRQTCSVVLIVDAPYSGGFLNACNATGDQQRTVMTSGRSTDQALFLPPPLRTSFTEKVLSAGLQGNDLNTAFNAGKNFFKLFKNSIQPQLDDNGSGGYTFQDGNLAKTLYLGRRYAFAGDDGAGLPFILDATTTQTVSPGTLVSYNTTLIEGVEPSRVYLQLLPDSTSDLTPISQVAEVDLTRTSPTGWNWSATFNAPVSPGNYILVMYADYPDSAEAKPTEPQFTALVATGTPTGLPIKDLDGDGFEDAVEFRYGSSALSTSSSPPSGAPYNSTADTDGDGYKDFYEYGMGFDYTNSASYPGLADVNGDGAVTGADAIILKRIIVGTLQASDYSPANMDMNRDGQITGADAVILQRFVVQTVTALPTN